jgi:hypothetical protein
MERLDDAAARGGMMNSPAFEPSDPAQPLFARYGPSPLPNSRDDLVDKVIDRAVAGGPPVVAGVIKAASESGRRVLRAYARRMASLAVRRRSTQLLVRAAIAVVMGGLDQNALEALMVMPLIEHSAGLLETSLAGVFEQAATVVGHPGTVNLMVWLTRKPEDRTLASMGFVESSDEGGFRYKSQA